MGFKSFKVVTFDQFLDGYDEDDSGINCLEWFYFSEGDFGSEFEGLKGGNRMMSLVTLFGGLKSVFKVGLQS